MIVSTRIIPVSRSLFLCDFHVGYANGRVDLYGIFNAIRPAIYPHNRQSLVVFAQLTGGLGDVPFFFEIRRDSDELIRTTAVNYIHFSDRLASVQLAVTMQGVQFTEPGVYVVSLFCHNTWVCDTLLSLD
ncbi:MAG: hypothetical protein C0467_01840 [Planctomycetaceae bacterium]|nr:hypothetical protein [Planctomycetaceae bacterium]